MAVTRLAVRVSNVTRRRVCVSVDCFTKVVTVIDVLLGVVTWTPVVLLANVILWAPYLWLIPLATQLLDNATANRVLEVPLNVIDAQTATTILEAMDVNVSFHLRGR